jgi:hypothetical protein
VNGTRIGCAGYNPIKSIDFANKVALTQAANRRIAAHRANLCQIEGDQSRARTHARRNRCGLNPGVPPTYNDDIKLLHACAFSRARSGGQSGDVSRGTLLADAKAAKQRVE